MKELRNRIDKVDLVLVRLESEVVNFGKSKDLIFKEIQSLRDSRHDLNNKVSSHQVYIANHDNLLSKLTETVDEFRKALSANNKEWQKFSITMKVGISVALFMGAGFIGFVVFVGGKILHWW